MAFTLTGERAWARTVMLFGRALAAVFRTRPREAHVQETRTDRNPDSRTDRRPMEPARVFERTDQPRAAALRARSGALGAVGLQHAAVALHRVRPSRGRSVVQARLRDARAVQPRLERERAGADRGDGAQAEREGRSEPRRAV